MQKSFLIHSLPGGLPDWDSQGEACMKWRRFGKYDFNCDVKFIIL